MSAPEKTDPLAPARAKLDAKIAAAARTLIEQIEGETSKRSDEGAKLVAVTVPVEALATLRAQVSAWEAFNETLGDGS